MSKEKSPSGVVGAASARPRAAALTAKALPATTLVTSCSPMKLGAVCRTISAADPAPGAVGVGRQQPPEGEQQRQVAGDRDVAAQQHRHQVVPAGQQQGERLRSDLHRAVGSSPVWVTRVCPSARRTNQAAVSPSSALTSKRSSPWSGGNRPWLFAARSAKNSAIRPSTRPLPYRWHTHEKV